MKNQVTPIVLAFAVTGCMTTNAGTQIGSEGMLECSLKSSENAADLDAVPAGLTNSPREIINSLTGTFLGQQLDEDETPSDETVTLTVGYSDSSVAVEYYEVSGDDDVDYATDPCPPRYRFALTFALQADGFPNFEGALESTYTDDNDGNTWASSSDESMFDGTLPAPVTFNPDDWGALEPVLSLSANGLGDWYTALSWTAYNPDDVVQGADYVVENELLFHAMLAKETEQTTTSKSTTTVTTSASTTTTTGTGSYQIEGRWIDSLYLNTMYEFNGEHRLTYYCPTYSCNDAYWASLDETDALPTIHPYMFDGETITIDLNFGNIFESAVDFTCEGDKLRFTSNDTNLYSLGVNLEECTD